MQFFNYNGKLYKEDECVISVNSRGLRFGDGLYETMKSKDAKLFFPEDHFNRLVNGMEVLGFKIPAHFSADKLEQQVYNLLKKNNHQKIARIRFTVLRGDGGLYDDINNIPNYLIQSWSLADDIGQLNSNGLVLGIYKEVKKSCDILSKLKHNNFLPYVMAAGFAKQEKWNDAIVLNTSDRICDTTITNIFIVKDEIVYTPSLAQGCIAGIMRKHILQQLTVNNIEVIENEMSIPDLMDADEDILSNSIYNKHRKKKKGKTK